MTQYLSHTEALEYVQRMAGLSRDTFDSNIRPRLVERAYSDRVTRFSRIAIEAAIDNPSFEEGTEMLLRRRNVSDALEANWEAEWCRQKGSKTQRSLVDQVKREIGDWVLKKIDYNRIESWVKELRDRGLAEATISRRLTCLMRALRHAKIKGWLAVLPEKPSISIDNTRERYLTRAEENALLAACDQLGDRGRIMRHVITFLLDTAARVSDLAKVTPGDVTTDGVIFRDRKGGGSNKVPLTARAREALDKLLRDEWWQSWTADAHHPNKEVRDTELKNLKDRLTHDFRLVRNKAQILDVVLHICRHTCISRLVQAGMDLVKVQQWAGHKDFRMTLRYAHLSPTSLNVGKAILERDSQESYNVVDFEKRRISEE
jgi:integrase